MTTKPTPVEMMSAYYAAQDPDAKRKGKLAAIFRPNDRMERLLRLRAKDPATFASFGPTTRIEVGMYVQQREAAGYEPEGDDAA